MMFPKMPYRASVQAMQLIHCSNQGSQIFLRLQPFATRSVALVASHSPLKQRKKKTKPTSNQVNAGQERSQQWNRSWEQLSARSLQQEQPKAQAQAQPAEQEETTEQASTPPSRNSPLMQLCHFSGRIERITPHPTDATRAQEHTRKMKEQIVYFIDEHNKRVANEAAMTQHQQQQLQRRSKVPSTTLIWAKQLRNRREQNNRPLPPPPPPPTSQIKRRQTVDPARVQYINDMFKQRSVEAEMRLAQGRKAGAAASSSSSNSSSSSRRSLQQSRYGGDDN